MHTVVERLLRIVAVACSLVALASWGLFALDETRAASDLSAREVAGLDASRTADPSPSQERAREAAHSRAREAIDDADDLLVAPFGALVDGSQSRWVQRTVPMLLALLLYGFGLSYLARFARGRPQRVSLPAHR